MSASVCQRIFVAAVLLCLLFSFLPSACRAEAEEGRHYTVATVDYDKMYWGIGISYTRVIELSHNGEENGTLMATYELGTSGLQLEKPGYHIRVSRDGGETWRETTVIREKAAAVQSEWQPFLYELPRAIGGMPEGTVLCAACSVDSAHAKRSALRLYRSYDVGETWEQFATIAIGGGLSTGVWEPFLMTLPDGRLACYYSDSTDEPHYSQKMVMRISEDGVAWGEAIDIVAMREHELRPGMGTVARMNNGQFVMTYEMCNVNNPDCGNPVYYKFSADGVDWGDPANPGTKMVVNAQTLRKAVPGSCPYLAYCPDYGENGLLLCTSGFQTPSLAKGHIVYVNDRLGAPDAWKIYEQPVEIIGSKGGYSRAIFVSANGHSIYFVNNIPDPASEEGYYRMIFLRIEAENITF